MFEQDLILEPPFSTWRGVVRIWLDDVRLPPPNNWTWCKTVESAIALLEEGSVCAISLDHDLGRDNKTGYDLAKWIEEKAHEGKLPRTAWRVHTANSAAYKKMVQAMENADKYWKERENDHV